MIALLLFLLPLIAALFDKRITIALSIIALVFDAYFLGSIIFYLFAISYALFILMLFQKLNNYTIALFVSSFYLFNLISGGISYLIVAIIYSFISLGILASFGSKEGVYNYFVGSVIGAVLVAISLFIGNNLALAFSLLIYAGALPFNFFLFKAYSITDPGYNALLFASKSPIYVLILNAISFNYIFMIGALVILYVPLILAITNNEMNRIILVSLAQLGFLAIVGMFTNSLILAYSLAIGEGILFLSFANDYDLTFDLSLLGMSAIPISLPALFKIIGIINAIQNQYVIFSIILFLALEGYLLLSLLRIRKLKSVDILLSAFIVLQMAFI